MIAGDLENELYKRDVMKFSKYYAQCYIGSEFKNKLVRYTTENIFLPMSTIGFYKSPNPVSTMVYLIPHCSMFNFPNLIKA